MADATDASDGTPATDATKATDAKGAAGTTSALPPVHERTHARIPTAVGSFQLRLYANDVDDKEHLALVAGDIGDGDSILVRVHSECFTGEVVGSLRCDCGPQLARAIDLVAGEGRGVIVYLRQEGRGIGLADKLRAYNLQDEGLDTVDANLALGHGPDDRDYTLAAAILHALGVRSVRLLTNNPAKVASLQANGLTVVERVPMGRFETAENAGYLRAKVERMGHLGGGEERDPIAPHQP